MQTLPQRAMKFVDHHLTPAGRLQEIIYALIMVITVTSTVSRTVPDSDQGIRTLIFAVLGCNIAWGIVDGVMYILTSLFNRNRSCKMIRDAASAASPGDAMSVIDGEFNPPFEWMLDHDQRRTLNEEIMEHVVNMRPPPVKFTRQELIGGALCFVVTFMTTLPAVTPFFFVHDMHLAIRLSNAVALTMLFLVGFEFARLTDKNPLTTSVGLVALGGVVVIITIILGG